MSPRSFLFTLDIKFMPRSSPTALRCVNVFSEHSEVSAPPIFVASSSLYERYLVPVFVFACRPHRIADGPAGCNTIAARLPVETTDSEDDDRAALQKITMSRYWVGSRSTEDPMGARGDFPPQMYGSMLPELSVENKKRRGDKRRRTSIFVNEYRRIPRGHLSFISFPGP
jgi:hypothetical protein